jgi:hypothetical protein
VKKIGHIGPNCYLLKSHRPWIKQDALRKSEVEDSSSSKYVPPHMRHIKGKGNVICKNAYYNSAENVKKHSNKRSLPTCHHCGITWNSGQMGVRTADREPKPSQFATLIGRNKLMQMPWSLKSHRR